MPRLGGSCRSGRGGGANWPAGAATACADCCLQRLPPTHGTGGLLYRLRRGGQGVLTAFAAWPHPSGHTKTYAPPLCATGGGHPHSSGVLLLGCCTVGVCPYRAGRVRFRGAPFQILPSFPLPAALCARTHLLLGWSVCIEQGAWGGEHLPAMLRPCRCYTVFHPGERVIALCPAPRLPPF